MFGMDELFNETHTRMIEALSKIAAYSGIKVPETSFVIKKYDIVDFVNKTFYDKSGFQIWVVAGETGGRLELRMETHPRDPQLGFLDMFAEKVSIFSFTQLREILFTKPKEEQITSIVNLIADRLPNIMSSWHSATKEEILNTLVKLAICDTISYQDLTTYPWKVPINFWKIYPFMSENGSQPKQKRVDHFNNLINQSSSHNDDEDPESRSLSVFSTLYAWTKFYDQSKVRNDQVEDQLAAFIQNALRHLPGQASNRLNELVNELSKLTDKLDLFSEACHCGMKHCKMNPCTCR